MMHLRVHKAQNDTLNEINIPTIKHNNTYFINGVYPIQIVNHHSAYNVFVSKFIKNLETINYSSDIQKRKIEGHIYISGLQRETMQLALGDIVTIYLTDSEDIYKLNPEVEYHINVHIKQITGNGQTIISKKKLQNLIQTQLKHICINNNYIYAIEDDETQRKIQISIKIDGYDSHPYCYYNGENIKINKITLSQQTDKKCLLIDESNKHVDIDMLKSVDLSELGIGGLKPQIVELLRRVFASRVCDPKMIQALQLSHVKGVLLYGPPGTGKTLIARQLGKMLNSVEPIVVNGPEILSKYVGESAENIRKLFKEAEDEYRDKGEYSRLHVIIFDEFDAIAGNRTAGDSAGSQVGNQIVNQLLAKMDGVESLNNILIFGLTNRKELIDNALLRPGRFEVQLEIGIPDLNGRHEIFNIHLKQSKNEGALSSTVDTKQLAKLTDNFTGAEIAGVVRNAITFAIYREINQSDNKDFKLEKSNMITIQNNDLMQAIKDMQPLFGKDNQMLDIILPLGITLYENQQYVHDTLKSSIDDYLISTGNQSLKILIAGKTRQGKSTIAIHLAKSFDISNIIYLSNYDLIGQNDFTKNSKIKELYIKATTTGTSIIVLDDIDNMMEVSDSKRGFIFNNSILQTFRTLWSKNVVHKVIFITTVSNNIIIDDLGMTPLFDHCEVIR